MQDSRRFRLNCTQITGSVNSHSPLFIDGAGWEEYQS